MGFYRKPQNIVIDGYFVLKFPSQTSERRGDRAVEGARLEIVCTPNKGTGGSNPPLSAILGLWIKCKVCARFKAAIPVF